MPIPEPEDDESKQEFMDRCLSDKNIKEEFGAGTEQALGVCFGKWRENKAERLLRGESVENVLSIQKEDST